jgi:hypothetical protein
MSNRFVIFGLFMKTISVFAVAGCICMLELYHYF